MVIPRMGGLEASWFTCSGEGRDRWHFCFKINLTFCWNISQDLLFGLWRRFVLAPKLHRSKIQFTYYKYASTNLGGIFFKDVLFCETQDTGTALCLIFLRPLCGVFLASNKSHDRAVWTMIMSALFLDPTWTSGTFEISLNLEIVGWVHSAAFTSEHTNWADCSLGTHLNATSCGKVEVFVRFRLTSRVKSFEFPTSAPNNKAVT